RDEERRAATTQKLEKIGGAEIQVNRISQSLAAEPDAKRAAHHAICTVASYEVVGPDVPPLTALEVDDFCADAVLRRRKGFEPCAVLQAYLGKRPGETLQDRIEPHLRAHVQPHRAVRLRLLDHARRAWHAADLIAGQACHERNVEGIVGGKWAPMHVVCDASPTAELHGADIHLVHLRRGDRTVALLDQRARDAPPTQLACEREPDGATADDE